MAQTTLEKMHGRDIEQLIQDKSVSNVLRSICRAIDKLSAEVEEIKANIPPKDQ